MMSSTLKQSRSESDPAAQAGQGNAIDFSNDPSGQGSAEPVSRRTIYTLSACSSCRTRKTKCGPELPKCRSCVKRNVPCMYWDPIKQKMMERSEVIRLQHKIRALEAELARLELADSTPPNAEDMVRRGGLVQFDEEIEPRYLGASSGIAMSRLVMEQAKEDIGSRNVRDLFPAEAGRRRNNAVPMTTHDIPSETREEKIYPSMSEKPASRLLTRAMADGLVGIFCAKSQFLLPTLHEPTFRKDIDAVYDGSDDPYQNFVLRIVLAISIQKVPTMYRGLADGFYQAAFEYLPAAMRPMDLKTLQCLVLIGQYSLLTPTRTAVYYVIGLATKLCQQLGLHQEETIELGGAEREPNPLEKDMRRRLFWIITSMEYGLSHSLGRPSAMSIGPGHIDVHYFEPVDDVCITAEGILPGDPSPKKLIAIHFFRMRLLQAEIRRKLYQKKRDHPKNDSDPWFAQMEAKMIHWRDSSPYNAEGSGHSNAWFTSKYNTIVVMLYRPSPQIANPSPRAAMECFNASAYNLALQRRQIENKSVDITWILVASLFMALNTVLWSISYPDVRRAHSKSEVRELADLGLQSIYLCADRWPGTTQAFGLYTELVQARLRVYDDAMESYQDTISSWSGASPPSLPFGSTLSEQSSPVMSTAQQRPSLGSLTNSNGPSPQSSYGYDHQSPAGHSNYTSGSMASPGYLNVYGDAPIDVNNPNVFNTSVLDPLAYDPQAATVCTPANGMTLGTSAEAVLPSFLASAPDYSFEQLLYPTTAGVTPQRQESLSQAEQQALMETFETDGMHDIDQLLTDSENFFKTLSTP